MTEFEKIITAIEPFGLPYAPDIYEGSEERFFVYNYADERAVFYADNAPAAVRASVQVHLYIPAEENFIVLKNRVRRALYQQGFTYPEVTVLREVKKRHIIFECDIEEEMEEKVMAYVGLAKPTVAKLDESSGTPKYTDGFTCGKAMALDISPQYAEGSLFADNKKSEYDKEFKYADVTLGTDTLPIQAHTVMFGHTVSSLGK